MRKVGSPRVARIGGAQIPLGTTSLPYNIESLVVIFSPVLFEGTYCNKLRLASNFRINVKLECSLLI